MQLVANRSAQLLPIQVETTVSAAVRPKHGRAAARGCRAVAAGASALAAAGGGAVAVTTTKRRCMVTCCCTSEATSSNSSTLAPTAENADAALTPSMAAAAAASNDLGFTGAEDRQLWDSVSRALLKLGKSGLADSHVNSLKELLVAHLLVKVELNGARSDVDVTAAAEEMATRLQGIGRVLQVRGRTLLLADSTISKEQLLARAELSAANTAVWKAKRQLKRQEAAAKRAGQPKHV